MARKSTPKRKKSVKYVYVAGPYTNGDTAENVRLALQIGHMLFQRGFMPYIPHLSHFHHLIFPLHYEDWVKWGLEWLRQCDAMIRIPGKSPGSDREVKLAKQLGIPVYYSLEAFRRDYPGELS